jgi:hypothetical protein
MRIAGQSGPEVGQSDPVAVGSIPRDKPSKTAPGTVEVFGPPFYTRGL